MDDASSIVRTLWVVDAEFMLVAAWHFLRFLLFLSSVSEPAWNLVSVDMHGRHIPSFEYFEEAPTSGAANASGNPFYGGR